MAEQPTVGSTLWGAAQNAFTATSIDPATGKIKNEALQVDSTAPIADAALANKKYVDDRTTMVPSVTGAGTGYAGTESVTLPNGLIMKTGAVSGLSGTTSGVVSFGVAFPNTFKSVTFGFIDTTATTNQLTVTASSVANFNWVKASALNGFYWTAWGY